MKKMTSGWDYLIVTAANAEQAKAYDIQIRQREEAGAIREVRHVLVIPDLEGRRIGSGGSTLHCLLTVLQRERPDESPASFNEAEQILSKLRILIVHAGGDSRRLPAYSHCGKMFVPLPGSGKSSLTNTLFDRLVPAFFALPQQHPGQIVVASGDALILFDGSAVQFSRPGITALGSFAPPHQASHHGVFCCDKNGSVRRFLQKPSSETQIAAGAVNGDGDAVLDLGVMSFDALAAVQLLRTFCEPGLDEDGKATIHWAPETREVLLSHGIDLYREICCALGTDTTLDEYVHSVGDAGSALDAALLADWFKSLRQIPFNLNVLPHCEFLHFGTTRQLITSGSALLEKDSDPPAPDFLLVNSCVHAEITADQAWIEGCSVGGKLILEGGNVIVGVEVAQPLRLRKDACLDMSLGKSRKGEKVWFFRYYGTDDTFKHSSEEGGSFCGLPLGRWLSAMGALASDIWAPEIPEGERKLWTARVFPALKDPQEFRQWLWLMDPESGTNEQKIGFLDADRYSSSEIALRVDHSEFQRRRSRIQATTVAHENREPAVAGYESTVDGQARN
jgi:fucokinase